MKDRRGSNHQAYFDTGTDEPSIGEDDYAAPVKKAEAGPSAETVSIEDRAANASEAAPNTLDDGAVRPTAPASADPVAEPPAAEPGSTSTAGDARVAAPQPNDMDMPSDVAATPINVPQPAGGGAAGGGSAPSTYAGDDMGWDAAAFAEAGGYDAILMGQLPPGMCPGEGDGSDVFIFIDELNITNIENTLIQNTEINLIADDGSVLEIGGDFTAIQTQESLVFDGPIGGGGGVLSDDPAPIEADAMAA